MKRGATKAATVLMTWAPHQERVPRTTDGNRSENSQPFYQLIRMVEGVRSSCGRSYWPSAGAVRRHEASCLVYDVGVADQGVDQSIENVY